MPSLTYATSAILALAGIGSSIFGIIQGETKPCAVGFVLLCGATVFAILYLGNRRWHSAQIASSPNPGNSDLPA